MEKEEKPKMTPAAIAALTKGDLENARTAMTPGGIEAQEKAGQTTFVANATLPKECPRKDLEALGFRFGEDVDGIFVSVTMPAGWKKVATEHSMWSDLLDDKGRKRGAIFYKAAFYDRNAHMHLERRYSQDHYVSVNADGSPAEWNKNTHFAVVAKDCGKEIHRVGLYAERDYKACDDLEKQALAWLNENFPKWQDATAYWD